MPPRQTRPKKKKPDVLPLPSTGAAPRKDIDKQQSKKKKKQKTGHKAPTTKEAHLNNIHLEQEAGDSTAEAMTTPTKQGPNLKKSGPAQKKDLEEVLAMDVDAQERDEGEGNECSALTTIRDRRAKQQADQDKTKRAFREAREGKLMCHACGALESKDYVGMWTINDMSTWMYGVVSPECDSCGAIGKFRDILDDEDLTISDEDNDGASGDDECDDINRGDNMVTMVDDEASEDSDDADDDEDANENDNSSDEEQLVDPADPRDFALSDAERGEALQREDLEEALQYRKEQALKLKSVQGEKELQTGDVVRICPAFAADEGLDREQQAIVMSVHESSSLSTDFNRYNVLIVGEQVPRVLYGHQLLNNIPTKTTTSATAADGATVAKPGGAAKTATSTTTADGPTVAKPTTSAIIVHDDTAAKSTTSAATASAQKPVTQGWKKKVDWKKFDTLKNQKDTKAIMAGSAGGIVKVDVVTFSEILVVMRINPGVSGWYRGMDNSLAFKGMMNFTSYPLAGQVDGQSMEFAHWRIMQDAEEAFAQGPGENLDRASITTVQDMAIKNGNNMPVRVGKVLEPTATHPAGKQPKDFSKRTVGSLSSNFMIAVSPAAIACKNQVSERPAVNLVNYAGEHCSYAFRD